MSVDILSAGPMLSVQDAGRNGLRYFGVSSAGPIDANAMALANALCGNPGSTAALEFAGYGGRFRASRSVRFAVTGGPCEIRVENRLVAVGESHWLAPGETLSVGVLRGVVWGYIAFSGGIETEPVLGSRATHLRSGLGGVDGRGLRTGDGVRLGHECGGDCLRMATPLSGTRSPLFASGPIRMILGPQSNLFAPDILTRLTSETFVVTPQRDRMAMTLGGVELPALGGHDIVSDGTVPGSVQVPGSGVPLVLLAESQTTGGYPKIATIASVDLPRLAQLPVGASVRFATISREEGEDLWVAQRRDVRAMLDGLVPKPDGVLSSEYLLSCDLVGGVTAPDEIAGMDLDG
ncbi:biotin-dependent carboxyltransferase family protein [Roseovarius pelagicus]|uniref:Biotin-dependent carboxyltransferase family protein n=1 Tax=Roseovarius pelagicus TaxID=2980108 RepID=A0ABY6D9G3_9RHOB|nr:biotin-dependent carboxyltransferase family protein [Roseovarius pelagicus]UXX82787.1 biotin-dependent carboxyltransferase family protein [Roseovarius pelagicus]